MEDLVGSHEIIIKNCNLLTLALLTGMDSQKGYDVQTAFWGGG
ncbi:hypothetical protein ACT7C2_13700 [Bacillus pacificus]